MDGLRPTFFGLVLGLAGSGAVVRQIKSMLYQTPPLDLTVFAVVPSILLGVAVLACIAPAWRASRLDPIQVLRTQ
jgi:putative ABC transport system permease protein